MTETLHIHRLEGCAPSPLAHYLKALGVLRLVAEQADPGARGWWQGERFHLLTRLDHPALADFFLDRYAPTPLITPWNGGSGFYPKDNTEGLAAIASSTAPRLSAYRDAIAIGQALTRDFAQAPKNELKAALQRDCRARWRGPLAEWLDAAVVLGGDGDPSYPALLGTGGNDGRLDFTNNFMRRLAGLFDMSAPQSAALPDAAPLLAAALWGDPAPGLSSSAAIGQFLPGGAGGANQGTGFGADSLINPWDFILMLEGAIVFRASLVRRTESQELPQASAPFALRGSAVGYGSAADADESARGEQWMPLWSAPTTYAEVAQLFAEGRSKLGARTAQRPLEFARAIARLGVARGIEAFERFGYIERNGQANLAVPLGRWRVQARPHQDLLDDIAGWVDTLRAAGRVNHAPAGIRGAGRACEEAMLACCRQTSALYWQALLLRLAEAEQAMLHSPRFTRERELKPLPRLAPGWLEAAGNLAANENAARELRLALAVASLHGREHGLDDPIRRHWLPLDLSARHHSARFRVTQDALDRPQEAVAAGRNLLRDALQVLRRRAINRGVERSLALVPVVSWAHARLDDIAVFLRGELDDQRCLTLALACMALDWPALTRQPRLAPFDLPPDRNEHPGALYGLLRLAVPLAPIPSLARTTRDPLTGERIQRDAPAIDVALDPAVLERLLAEDLRGAFAAAVTRLQIAGLRPRLALAAAPREGLRRLAASLIFPLALHDLHDLAGRLTKSLPAEEPDLSDTSTDTHVPLTETP